MKIRFTAAAGLALILAAGFQPLRAAENPIPLVTGRFITPMGTHVPVGGFPTNLAPTPDGKFLAVTGSGVDQRLSILDGATGALVSQIEVNGRRTDGSNRKEGLYFGLAFASAGDAGYRLFASRGAEDRVAVHPVDAAGKIGPAERFLDNPSGVPKFELPHNIAGLALSADGARLYAVNNGTGQASNMKGSLSVIDIAANKVLGKVELPGFPYAIATAAGKDGAGEKLYVTSERDSVVAVVDPAAMKVIKEIPVGRNPAGIVHDADNARVFVSNAGSDTVSVISTATDTVAETILVRPDDARGLPGATPLGMALAHGGKHLYAAVADMNAIARVNMETKALEGFLPAGWYPTAVAVDPTGKTLFAASAKGTDSRHPNADPAEPAAADQLQAKDRERPNRRAGRYILDVIGGAVSAIALPDEEGFRAATAQAIVNNFTVAGRAGGQTMTNPGIEHVVYIVKENRTYDQVLGDLPQGNGDPSLCLFPREVTPNQHALAERFVLLDNFYVCAEVSADGWNWSTSGMINEYTARNTYYNYAGRGRRYDFEGQNNGVPVDLQGLPDVAEAPSGYIWDHCVRHKVSFRNYGFFNAFIDADVSPTPGAAKLNQPTKRALQGQSDPNFLLYSVDYADSDAWVVHDAPAPRQRRAYGEHGAKSRIEAFRREFEGFVKDGGLPQFLMVRFCRDHTAGTSFGHHSPRSMVADNDYAVGQLVEMISRSPYWEKTAIFILEDDAQAGHDHVDAHRSIAFVISPFVKKGSIDHSFYNTDSMLSTMGTLLGMPPMNQLVAVAPLMTVFGDKPENAEPYEAILPAREIIAEVNSQTAYGREESESFNFEEADATPEQPLNRILWHSIKGADVPSPPIRYGLRLFAEVEEEEEEREREAGRPASAVE